MRSRYERLKAFRKRYHPFLNGSRDIKPSTHEVTDTDDAQYPSQPTRLSHEDAPKSISENADGEESLESDEDDDVSDITRPTKAKSKSELKATPSISHGLFILYPPPDLPTLNSSEIDIIAVHGLNGTPRGTWTDKESKSLWLQDFLPVSIPNARIMTFGYDSKLVLSRARDGIEEFAKELLNQIWVLRQSERNSHRPLIFLAHSLGGIVVKKAIILAHENNSLYGHIVSSTTGIVFLATPHQGSDLTKWASLLTLISKRRLIRADLIESLKPQSSVLSEISKSFLPRTSDLTIVSFVETQVDPRYLVLVVPKESAQMGTPNEMVFPVNAHHRTICRFSSSGDPTYVSVVATLKMMMEKAFSKVIFQNAHALPSDVGGKGLPGRPSPEIHEAPATCRTTQPGMKRAHWVADQGPGSRADSQLKLANRPGEAHLVNIRIHGLKGKISAKDRGWIPHSRTLVLPGLMEYSKVLQKLRENAPDVVMPDAFQFRGRSTKISDEWKDCFTIPVLVTDTQSCYVEQHGYQINFQQTISSFFSKLFPSPITAKLERHQSRPHYISVQRSNATVLRISLMRTVQVGGVTPCTPPRGFGAFPLFDTQQYKEQLPIEAAIRGGLFLPMHEQEAMYISLHGQRYISRHRDTGVVAVRPFAGGINTITGKQLYSGEPRSSETQDYFIAPGQKRIDGIAIRPGIARQFVATRPDLRQQNDTTATSHATPLANSLQGVEVGKGTIEWQMSGKDDFGGLQLQIIPQYELWRIFAGNVKDASPQYGRHRRRLESYRALPEIATAFDVLKTPEELGLKVGDVIHIKDLGRSEGPRVKLVKDLHEEAPDQSDILELEATYNPSRELVISIKAPEPEADCIRFKVNLTEELSDIQRAAQDVLLRPDGVLHAPCRIADGSVAWCPVTTWDDIRRLVNPSNEIVLHKERLSKPIPSETLTFDPGAHKRSPLPPDITLVLMPRSSKMVCIIHFLDDAAKRFREVRKPFFIEISQDSTISTIRRMIETITNLPTHDLWIGSGSCPILQTDDRVLGHDVDAIHAMPGLVVYNVLGSLTARQHTSQRFPVEISYSHCRRAGTGLLYQPHNIRVTLGTKRIFEGKAKDVAELKMKIFNSLGIDRDIQDLGLQDDFSLVGEPRTLRLTIRPPQPITLGVGAGGLVAQSIVRDTSDPRMWDVNNSQILHVHIIKAEHFHKVTGLPAPETPIRINQGQQIHSPSPGDWEQKDSNGGGIGMSRDEYDLLDDLHENYEHRGSQQQRVGGFGYEEGGDAWMGTQDTGSLPLTLLAVNHTMPRFQGNISEW